MKFLITVLAMLLLLPRAWANCSTLPCEVTLPTSVQTATMSSSSLLNTSSFRIEVRLVGNNWTSTPSSGIFGFGGLGVRPLGSLFYFACAGHDTIPAGCGNFSPNINYAGSTGNDILIRLSRNITDPTCAGGVCGTQTMEVYDTATGANLITTGSSSYTATISALATSAQIQSLGITFGAVGATGHLAFLRVYNGSVTYGTPIPVGIAGPAALADYEWNNVGTDSSGLAQNFSGSYIYSNAPTYASIPQGILGAARILRHGIH